VLWQSTSIVTIFAALFTGKYEQALFLPKQDNHAINLMAFSIFLSLVCSIGLFGLMISFYDKFASFLRLSHSSGYILLYVPLMTFIIGTYSCFQLWFQRKEAYSVISVNAVIQSLILIITNILLAFIGIRALGLVWGYITAVILAALFMIGVFIKRYHKVDFLKNISWKRSFNMAIEYKRFPQYIIWAELLVILSQQLTPLLLTSLFTPVVVGYFSFSNRILRIPSIIFAGSIWGIYRNEAVKVHKIGESLKPIYISTLKRLMALGVFPYFIISIFGATIFQFVFGNAWRMSGIYAQIMALFLFTELIAYPLSGTFIVCGKQRTFLFIQILTVTLGMCSIVLGKIIGNDITSVILFSVSGILSNSLSITLSYKLALKNA
jgi:teichuronic acid exporter